MVHWFLTKFLAITPYSLPSSHHSLHLGLRVALLPKSESSRNKTLHIHPDVPSPQLANQEASLPTRLAQILHNAWAFTCPLGKVSKNKGHSFLQRSRNPETTVFPKLSHPSSLRSKLIGNPSPSEDPTSLMLVPLLSAWVFPSGSWGMGMRSVHMQEREKKERDGQTDRQTSWGWAGKDFSWLRVISRNTQYF